MKRLLAILLSLAMILTCVSVSFAEENVLEPNAITKIFVSKSADGSDYHYFVFSTVDSAAEEAGIKIGDTKYSVASEKLEKAKADGKFGIVLLDPDSKLDDIFKASPYQVVAGVELTGAERVFAQTMADRTKEDKAVVSLFTADGKAIPGFYTGSTESDYYYGLDEMPETPDELPEIAIESPYCEFTETITEEVGGYVATYTGNFADKDGVEKTAAIRLHYREFAEVTTTVKPHRFYDVRYNYVKKADASSAYFVELMSGTDLFSSNKYKMTYIAYEVEDIKGYTPVEYTVSGVRTYTCTPYANDVVCNSEHTISAYNYDGVIDYELPGAITDDNMYVMFNGFRGYNPVDAFLATNELKNVDKYNNTFTSTSVKPGSNILIYRNDSNEDHIARLVIDANNPMTMTVKYVEKNPADITDSDATLSDIKVGKTTINGFASDVDTYYYGVESLEALPEVTATATQSEKSSVAYEAACPDNLYGEKITVTSKDGTTKKYTVYFREIKTKTVPVANEIEQFKTAAYGTLKSPGGARKGVDVYTYYLYNTGLSAADNIIVSANITETLTASLSGYTRYYGYALNDIESYVDAETGLFNNKDAFIGARGFSEDYYLGEAAIPSDGSITGISLDASKIKLTENGYFIILSDKYNEEGYSESGGRSYSNNNSVTLSYIEKTWVDPAKSDATLSDIKVNEETIADFDPEITEYYCGVKDITIYDVKQTVTQHEYAVAFPGEPEEEENGIKYTITVGAYDGTEKTYTLHLRQIQSETLPVVHEIEQWSAYTYGTFKSPGGARIAQNLCAYFLYDTGLSPADNIIVSASISGKRAGGTSGTMCYYGYALDDLDTHVDKTKTPVEFNNKDAFAKAKGLSDGCLLAQSTSPTVTNLSLDTSKIKLSENGYLVIIANKSDSTEQGYFQNNNITISYIVK